MKKLDDFVISYQREVINDLLLWNRLQLGFHNHIIQYLSIEIMKDHYKFFNHIIQYLKDNDYDNIINIGCGIGLLESIAKNNNLNISSSEILYPSLDHNKLTNDFDPFKLIRSKLGVKVNHWTKSIFDREFKIDNYEIGLLIRFTPLTEDCTCKEDYEKIFKNLKKYISKVIIADVKNKVPKFLNEYKKYELLDMEIYEIELEKFNFSKIELL